MAIRDVVVLNTTSSRLEVQQSSDSIRISGTSTQLLSIENSSGTSVFELNAPSSSISFTGNITASGNFSSSIQTVSSSFGRIQATKLVGTAGNLTNTELGTGIVSGSTQLESEISGAFDSGFNFTGTIGKAVGVFSVGGALINAQKEHTGTGLRNAALQFGGSSPLGQCTEEYNGTAWSAGGAKITAAYYMGSAGYLTSALSIGGLPDTDETEKYDGTAWSETGNMITGRRQLGSTGIQNAAIAFGGRDPAASSCTETFDGSTWSEVADMTTARCRFGSAGSQNSALAFGGQPNCTCTEEWDGASWSSAGALLIGTTGMAGGGVASTVNAAISIGGGVSPGAYSEEYNGTSWSTGGTLIQCRNDFGAGGSQDSIVAFGGCTPAASTCTEEYDGFLPVSASFGKLVATTISADASKLENTGLAGTVSSSTQIASDISGSFRGGFEFTGTIGTTAAVWSSGPDISYNYQAGGSAGLRNAGLIFGNSPLSAITSHYNGSSWSLGGSMAIGRRFFGGTGTEYAALAVGNLQPISADTEEYYGETWAAGGNLITARAQAKSAGTQNAAVAAGGCAPSTVTCTEEYDGASWAAGGALIYASKNNSHVGSQNSSVYAGSGVSPYLHTQEYNGTSWSESSALSVALSYTSMAGVQNAAVLMGGYDNQARKCVFEYNGNTWSTSTDMIQQQFSSGGAGTMTSALLAGGNADKNCTQHYDSYIASASFARLDATTLVGSGIGLSNKIPVGTLSGSAQIAGDITGSFIRGVYGMTGEVSTATGVWSTGVSLNTPRNGGHGAGTTGGGLVSGGQTPSIVANTEEWNGTTWSESGDLITARKHLRGSTGAQDSALMGGAEPGFTCTEEYNGSTWASGGALSSNRKVSVGFGTQNAAVQTGNYQCTADWTALYDGTAWSRSARPTFHTPNPSHGDSGTDHFAGAGTQNAGLVFAGRVAKTCTEHFDGTSWSKGGSLSTGKSYANGSGVENAALAFGGSALSPSNNVLSEEYDGVAWSSGGSMITAAGNMNTFGTLESTLASHRTVDTQEYSSYHLKTGGTCIEHIRTTSTFIDGLTRVNTNFFPSGSDAFCGSAAKECYGTMLSGSGVPNNTLKRNKQDNKLEVKRSFQMPVFYTDPVTGSAGELWYNAVDNALKFTFDYNAWSAGGALLIDRMGASHAGSQNAALAIGGKNTAANANTGSVEEYNGSTWSIGGAIPIAMVNKVAHGTQNAALAGTGNTEYYAYNGTSWSEVADNNVSRDGSGGAGSQNAALLFGGYAGNPTKTEAYNGMSWTVKAELIAGRGYGASGGVVNAAILAGGLQPGAAVSCTEHFDGSTWSAGGAINHARYLLGGSGNQYAMVIFGDDGDQNCTEEYNGTTWNEVTGIITARKCFGSHSSGNQSNALATGGRTASPNTSVSCTEEYSATYVKTVCLDS